MESAQPTSQQGRPAAARGGPAGRTVLEWALLGAALVYPAAWLGARLDWRLGARLDLLTHLREPALAVTLAAVAVLARRRPRVALALGCLAILQAAPLFRYAGKNPVAPDPGSHARLRVLVANVLWSNTRYDALARLIRDERPDIVGLVEVTDDWLAGLAEVRAEYPYRMEAPGGATGLALWFREPPPDLDPPRPPLPGAWPFIHARFTFAGVPRHLWLIHPSPPMVRYWPTELDALARAVGSTPGSRIVVGDMNCSEGSPRFDAFLTKSGLRDSRLGFGRQPSWPVGLPYRIAIDHAFVSGDLAVVDRRLGPPIGSDHASLILDLAPASSPRSRN
jgi:endonuclease/exonuclease/phosphatase (EEP) superfamily protein YafD